MLLASQIVGLFDQQYFKKKSMDHFQFDIQKNKNIWQTFDKQKKEKTFQKNISCLNFSKILRGNLLVSEWEEREIKAFPLFLNQSALQKRSSKME